MSTGQRFLVWSLSWSLRKWGDHKEIRRIFDEKYADEPEEWRRDIWQQAAERAQRSNSG